jgi:hypothetical protein
LTPGSGPGWVKNQDPDLGSGSGINIPDHIFESLVKILGLNIVKFSDAELDPGFGIFLTLDPGSRREKFGFGINIPDPQHWKEVKLFDTCLKTEHIYRLRMTSLN